jgi:hypothetical protein
VSEIKRTADELEPFTPSSEDMEGWTWNEVDIIIFTPEIDNSLPF